MTAEIPVHPIIAEMVGEHASAFPCVFPGRREAHLTGSTIEQWVEKVGNTAGIAGLSPHRLRNTVIATVNDAAGDLRMAQEFARHTDIETTVIYTRVGADRLRRAVATLDFLERS